MTDTAERELAAYHKGRDALLGLIRGEHTGSRTPDDRRERAVAKLERTRSLLAALGDPHRRYPSVHVTGTSGKGSTAAAVAAMMSAGGYRVGLRTSPYLQVMTEKLQIGRSLIDAASFARTVDHVLSVGRELFRSDEPGKRLGYAEAWTAISLLCFAQRDVDLAVVEVGAGGRFDATNVLTPVVSMITSVGLDHVVSLGPSIADIAWHKAGIIKPGVPVVVGDLPAAAEVVVRETARIAGSEIIRGAEVPLVTPSALPGFQQRNAAIATAAVHALERAGFPLAAQAVTAGLRETWLPARLERMPGHDEVVVWIDGAHNPDKIDALLEERSALGDRREPPVLVVGVLGSKDVGAIVARLRSCAAAIVATEPRVHGKRALPAASLAGEILATGYDRPMLVEPDSQAAILKAIAAAAPVGAPVLVTGSLYLAGEIRRLWYPDEEIVLQRTPWPRCDAPRLQELRVRSVARYAT